MLLSFAQFEREVTAERIRDKIAQSKARGMWMGGYPPIGYQPNGRSLAIVEQHAAIVRHVFDRYLQLRNVRLLQQELIASGVIKPNRLTSAGRPYGGAAFNRSELYTMLGNRIYAGDIVHRDKVWPGLHPPIISRETFDTAQQLIARHVKGERSPPDAHQRSLLVGRVADELGEPLLATHASKAAAGGKRRYRYYVTKALLQGTGRGMRIPALELEHLVIARLTEMLADPLNALRHQTVTESMPERAFQRGQRLASELRGARVSQQRDLIRRLVAGVVIGEDKVVTKVNWVALCELLGIAVQPTDEDVLILETLARLARSGRALRMVQHDGCLVQPSVDLTLVRLIVKARSWWKRLQQERGLTVSGMAAGENVTQSYVTRVLRLAFLSPEVVKSIIAGKQPTWMDSGALTRDNIALDWEQQKRVLLMGRAS